MAKLTPKIVPGDWNAVAHAIAKLDSKLNTGATPTFTDLTLSSPSNIHGLSHDSFANFVSTEHLDHALTKDANLINWWRMDDITGTTVTDLGSGSDDGTLRNGASQTTGVIGKGVNFNGVNQDITLSTYTATNELSTFSVAVRFKINDSLPFTSAHAIVCLGDASNRIPWIFAINGTSTIRAQMYDGSTVTQTDYTMISADVGKWHTLIYTYNWTGASEDGDAILYIDGVSQDTDKTISTSGVTSSVGFIGNNSASEYMDGEVDDVKVYDRVLSPAEVLEITELGTLDAMTTFSAAYFKKYIASRSGYFNNLNVSGIITANAITTNALTVIGGSDIDINISRLIGVGDILPEDDGSSSLGSGIKTFKNLYVSEGVSLNNNATIGIEGGIEIVFDDGNKYFEFVDGKVGIETATPATELDVNGTITATALTVNTGELTAGSINRAADTLTLEIAGTPELSISANLVAIANGLTVDTDTLVVDAVNNRVGIGTASPDYLLDVWHVTSVQDDKTMRVYYKTSATAGYSNQGLSVESTAHPASNSTAEVYGLKGRVMTLSGNTFNHGTFFGLRFTAQHFGSGTLSRATGIHAYPYNGGVGTINTAHAFFTYPWMASGTINNWYGLYIDNKALGTGSITNLYGVYVRESTAINYFAGNVGIGTTTPGSSLAVVGLPAYANNAAAISGGLTAGDFYRTGADPDPVCVVH